jgi:uncharacterized membrane protein YphA (DoxX/SURF4 family)
MREQREPDVRLKWPRAEPSTDGHDGHRDDEVRIVRETVPAPVPANETVGGDVVQEPAPASSPWLLGSAVRVAFGLIWAIDAWFKWQPEFQNNFMKIMQAGADSQPGWLGPWYQFWQTALQPYAHSLALLTAIIETVVALALIVGFARKPLYILGALWSLGIWALPEGFGNTSRAAYTDIGTSIIYVAVFAALWAIDSCTGPRRYSVDALIERYVSGWKHVAEVKDV